MWRTASTGSTSAAPAPGARAPCGWRARAPAVVTGLSLAYAATVVGLALLLHLAGDRWWVATLMLYGPRWPCALPLAVLVPAAAVCRRRLLWLLGGALVVVLVPFMGLCLPWAALSGATCRGPSVRVLTCNIHRDALDPEALGTLIAVTGPDVIALQDWSSQHEREVFAYGDWHVHRDGQLCLASRYPIRRAESLDAPEFRGRDSAATRYELETPDGVLRFVNLHLDSPRDGLDEVIHSRGARLDKLEANSELRRRQSEEVGRWLDDGAGPLLIAGDFNTPPESTVYRACWSDYANAFSSAGIGFGPTFFTRRAGVRIDHILAGPGWHCRRCWVGPAVGSPHHPVVADLCRTGSPD